MPCRLSVVGAGSWNLLRMQSRPLSSLLNLSRVPPRRPLLLLCSSVNRNNANELVTKNQTPLAVKRGNSNRILLHWNNINNNKNIYHNIQPRLNSSGVVDKLCRRLPGRPYFHHVIKSYLSTTTTTTSTTTATARGEVGLISPISSHHQTRQSNASNLVSKSTYLDSCCCCNKRETKSSFRSTPPSLTTVQSESLPCTNHTNPRRSSRLLLLNPSTTRISSAVLQRRHFCTLQRRPTNRFSSLFEIQPVNYYSACYYSCQNARIMTGKKVCIVGSGNWGSAIAKLVGVTVKSEEDFDDTVTMWVFEEEIEGKGKLSEIINETHENVKYLPGHRMPENIVANPDLVASVKEADILIFVVPHQFVDRICKQVKEHVKPGAVGITLIKGVSIDEKGDLKLISAEISEGLGINVHALMGANLAREVADGHFCEATIGATDLEQGKTLKRLFQTENFRIVVVKDAHTVELCGALKNVVACAAGFSDGLGYGDNTKAAVIRLATFFESCGIADLVTTCYGGRNRKVSEAFVKTGKTMQELEKEMLNGQALQGPHTAEQVYKMLVGHQMVEKYPLFDSVHRICSQQIKPEVLIQCLRTHPEHM